MLPIVEPDCVSSRRRIVAYSLVLLGVNLLPTLAHMTGIAFGVVALVLGSALIVHSFRIAMLGNEIAVAKTQAHRMLMATMFYLPALMIAFLLDLAMLCCSSPRARVTLWTNATPRCDGPLNGSFISADQIDSIQIF